MKFSKELLSNPVFMANWLNYDPDPVREASRHPEMNAVTLLDNGDYLFRIYAPNAEHVVFTPEYGDVLPNGKVPFRGIPQEAEKKENGYFEFVMPFNESKTGHRHIDVSIDGTKILWPYFPICWSGSHARNYVEVPDNDQTFAYVYDVPHGSVNQEVYFSKATGRMERCIIYTPPGYMNASRRYPVLYLQHGGGENEIVMVQSFRCNYILDNLIAAGECVPFIVVMNDGMNRYPDTPSDLDWRDTCLEQQLIQDCIPFIDSHYRTKTDSFSRALMGESMGCQQAADIAFGHPELFGNFGSLSSAFYHDDIHCLYERPWKKALENREKFLHDWKVIFSRYTTQEDHADFVLKDRELLAEAGLLDAPCMHMLEPYPHRYTRNCAWRAGIRDFARVLFRD